MNKKITDELLEKMLEDKGILNVNEANNDEKLKLVLDHYDSELVHDWQNYDFCFTTTETADGYELYLATEDDRRPDIYSDVYYYDHEWFEKLPDVIIEGRTIHVDEYVIDEYNFINAIDEVYEDFYNDKLEEIEDKLIDEGYVREEETETA